MQQYFYSSIILLDKDLLIYVDLYWSKIYVDFLTDEVVLGHKAPKFKVGDTVDKN